MFRAEAPSDAPKHLEGGVSFKFNFLVEDHGTSGQDEQQKRPGETNRLASPSAATKRPSAPAFEVFPGSVDVSSLQLEAVDLGLPSGPIFKVRVAGSEAGGRIAIDEEEDAGGGGTGRGSRSSASARGASSLPPPSCSLAHSDLVPGIYEGGFKLWEGAVDLARLLAEEVIEATEEGAPTWPLPPTEQGISAPHISSASPLVPLDGHLPRWLPGAPRPPPLRGARVLELGCGSALPSLVAAKAGAAAAAGGGRGGGGREGRSGGGPVSIALCDFNAEVLKACTAANVAANFWRVGSGGGGGGGGEGLESEGAVGPSFRYFAGDWSALRVALENAGALASSSPSDASSSAAPSSPPAGFDLILAAEVTYNPESYLPLADAIADLLAPPPAKSAALIAAKRHYFGVGGNVDGFIAVATARGRLRVERVAVVEGPLPRDVLLLTRI